MLLRTDAQRRVLAEDLQAGERTLDDEQARYVAKVLRLERGDEIELFDGRGSHAMAILAGVSKRAVTVDVQEVQRAPVPTPNVTVGVASPKGERADWLVEKLAEVGVARVVWLHTERSVNDPSPSRLERHRRVMESATRQCGGYWVPDISGPVPLRELIAQHPHGWVADPTGTPWQRGSAVGDERTLAIGPEGGFTSAELESFNEGGYTRIWLSPLILRVETAALVGAALLMGA